ncbi:MAG: hypothetical protein GF401_09310 [Chitinivibrionales bacterium]|nr:hypothetical protein [Chitinivibrionales bacterium]
MMGDKKTRLALVYDFDKTLTPRPMRDYINWPDLTDKKKGALWNDKPTSFSSEVDKEIYWMRKVKQYADLKPGRLTRRFFLEQGKNVTFFSGVESFFTRINDSVYSMSHGTMECNHYIISSSIKDVIEGTPIASHFRNIFASLFYYERTGPTFPQIVVNDAVKTQCLYRINKNRERWSEDVNEYMPEEERPVPFSNMIYLGDGLTDIPALSVVRKNGGYGIGVYSDITPSSLKTLKDLIDGNRIDFAAPADYSENSILCKALTTILRIIIEKVRLQQMKKESIQTSRTLARQHG